MNPIGIAIGTPSALDIDLIPNFVDFGKLRKCMLSTLLRTRMKNENSLLLANLVVS
jgi:hypothetical protein